MSQPRAKFKFQEAPMRQLCKGNVAIVKGAILAGCKAYYGYPITPASEIAEAAALYFPQVGGTFLQAESEIAAINMVYGAAATGQRVMSASSGPGLSLMQEGISYCAGSELPCVIVDIVRGGPGLGNIAPEQSDYFAMVKGGGHGCYRNFVLAPASVQEMADLTVLAFELADTYRNPAIILADGFIGQMMEPLELDYREAKLPEKPWAVQGTHDTRKNVISSIFLEPDDLEAHIRKLEAKYIRASRLEARHETFETERRRSSPRRLRHHLARAAFGRRDGPPRRPQGRPLPPHHLVAVPEKKPCAMLPAMSAKSSSSNSATARWWKTSACLSRAKSPSSSTAAPAAMCPRSRRFIPNSCNANVIGVAKRSCKDGSTQG